MVSCGPVACQLRPTISMYAMYGVYLYVVGLSWQASLGLSLAGQTIFLPYFITYYKLQSPHEAQYGRRRGKIVWCKWAGFWSTMECLWVWHWNAISRDP